MGVIEHGFPNVGDCFCYKCGRIIKEGEHKLSIYIALEEVINGDILSEVISNVNIPCICIPCASETIPEVDFRKHWYLLPHLDGIKLSDN
jgi:hypothetical protein